MAQVLGFAVAPRRSTRSPSSAWAARIPANSMTGSHFVAAPAAAALVASLERRDAPARGPPAARARDSA